MHLLYDEDLRLRAQRLLCGDHRTNDLDRLYLGLRERSRGFEAVREIGNFVAHRDVRNKGLVTQVGRDVFTSVDVWSMGLRGLTPSLADISRAADANLRLASEAQLKAGCGCGPATARKRVERALRKIERGEAITDVEMATLDYVGNRLVWRPAFLASQLAGEFERLLAVTGLASASELSNFPAAADFLTLHALAVMHGSSIIIAPGKTARLLAGYANRERRLEVKIEITFRELAKPLMTPICLFLSDLAPEPHCDAALIRPEPVLVDHWDRPIEVGPDGRLQLLASTNVADV